MSSSKSIKPITERSNPITSQLDSVNLNDFIDLIGQCEAQVFNGYEDYIHLLHPLMLEKMNNVINIIKKALKNKEKIIMSGSGTSGRMAYLMCRLFNPYLDTSLLYYTISGNDSALLLSDELPEDDPHAGINDLKQLIGKDDENIVYIGITCGLSSPYVAGQLAYCIQQQYDTILIGFNPIELARKTSIEKWNNQSVYSQVKALSLLSQQQPMKYIILNPIIGPEPLTASSRMKGGTCTKIILEILLRQSIFIDDTLNSTTIDTIKTLIQCYQQVHVKSYQQAKEQQLFKYIEAGGYSLNSKKNGHIYYLCPFHDVVGLLSFIDASEMPDTFGTPHQYIRCFIKDGWNYLKVQSGDLSHIQHPNHLFQISIKYFTQYILPTLTDQDTIILLHSDTTTETPHHDATAHLLQTLQEKKVHFIGMLYLYSSTKNNETHSHLRQYLDHYCSINLSQLPYSDLTYGTQGWYTSAMKYLLNIISTGAQRQHGMIKQNFMINMTVANNKLYYRSLELICNFAHCDVNQAEQSLLKVIYQHQHVNIKEEEYKLHSIQQHIEYALTIDYVIPQAIEIASSS